MHMKIYHYFTISCLFCFFSGCEPKASSLSLKAVKDAPYELEKNRKIDPIASEKAQKGGVLATWGGPYPRSLNYWIDYSASSAQVVSLLFEPLVELDSIKNEAVPVLAKSWKKKADQKTFIFEIHPEAKWSDGKPITAEDVQFYYDTIMNPKNRTTPLRVTLNRFMRPKVLSDKKVQIQAKKKYWKAFWNAGNFYAFPKHIWKEQDFNKIHFSFPVVSGPYELVTTRRNRFSLLKRRGNWWGRFRSYNQNKYNFDYIRFRYIEDRFTALEAFKKGDIDMYPIYTSSIWKQQTNFYSVRKNHVIRQEIYNKEPKGFQGFAINLRRPLFQELRVRKALCHLLNRKLMNEKLMFEQYFLLNSYFPDLYHPSNINPNVPQCEYNPVKARDLFAQAGWSIGKDGILVKNNKQFKITFLANSSDLRHLYLYLEDLKKAGVKTSIDQVSQPTAQERIDHFRFDLFWINRSSGRLKDPEAIFHSRSIDKVSSSNITGLNDPQVDRLLDQLLHEDEVRKRNTLLKRLDIRLVSLVPYILLWQADKTRLLYWNKFGTPKYVLDKFSRENAAIAYWWVDPKKEASLKTARKEGTTLSAKPFIVRYNGP